MPRKTGTNSDRRARGQLSDFQGASARSVLCFQIRSAKGVFSRAKLQIRHCPLDTAEQPGVHTDFGYSASTSHALISQTYYLISADLSFL